jgi:hypothetical protein
MNTPTLYISDLVIRDDMHNDGFIESFILFGVFGPRTEIIGAFTDREDAVYTMQCLERALTHIGRQNDPE